MENEVQPVAEDALEILKMRADMVQEQYGCAAPSVDAVGEDDYVSGIVALGSDYGPTIHVDVQEVRRNVYSFRCGMVTIEAPAVINAPDAEELLVWIELVTKEIAASVSRVEGRGLNVKDLFVS